MGFLSRLAGSLRRRTSLDRDLVDEQRYHIELVEKELESQGIERQEARRLAALRFGSRVEVLEETRRQDLLPWLDEFFRDLRIGWRGLRRSPSYSIVVLLALALGIGANTAIYTVVHAALFRPMPYPEAERLAFIYTKLPNGRRTWANFEDIQDWGRESKSFESIAAFTSQTVNLTGSGEPDRLRGGFVSDNFFATLGISPATGRSFLAGEIVRNGPRIAIASWGLWKEKFGGRGDLLGSKVVLNGEPYTIIGILPQNFDFPFDHIDVWLPFMAWPAYEPGRASINAGAIGRLKAGITIQSANEELDARIAAIGKQFPETNRTRIGAKVVDVREALVQDIREPLLVLGGAVFLALLVACANIATLTVSRVLSRMRELGIRAALGAGRGRLLAHLFSEQLLLSCAGGGLGLLLAYWFTRIAVLSDVMPPTMLPRVDWPVALSAFGLSVLSAVLTGLVPAISLLRKSALDVSAGGRGASENRSANRTRHVLVTASVAISAVLLVAAGLLIRSFNTLTGVEIGFDSQNLLTLEYRMPQKKYPNPEQQVEFHRRVAQEVAAVPGVQSATVMMALPFSGNGNFGPYQVSGRAPLPKGSEPRAQVNRVDPTFFETMRIPLLRGRAFTDADRRGSLRVVVVSKSMAEHCWPGEDPINRQLVLLNDREPSTVVGVVGDSKHAKLEEESRDKAYIPFAQNPHIFGSLAVRTSSNPTTFTSAVRQAIWKVDRDQPVWKVNTMETLVERSTTNRALLAGFMSGFSGFALLLAGIGLYGVISYSVARRSKELGIRAALGATRGMLVSKVLSEGMRDIGIGLMIGIVVSIPASALLREQLYQVSVTDYQPYATAAIALIVASLLAAAIPARRVASLDVSDILRQD